MAGYASCCEFFSPCVTIRRPLRRASVSAGASPLVSKQKASASPRWLHRSSLACLHHTSFPAVDCSVSRSSPSSCQARGFCSLRSALPSGCSQFLHSRPSVCLFPSSLSDRDCLRSLARGEKHSVASPCRTCSHTPFAQEPSAGLVRAPGENRLPPLPSEGPPSRVSFSGALRRRLSSRKVATRDAAADGLAERGEHGGLQAKLSTKCARLQFQICAFPTGLDAPYSEEKRQDTEAGLSVPCYGLPNLFRWTCPGSTFSRLPAGVARGRGLRNTSISRCMSSSPRSPPTDLTRKPSSATDGRTERVGGVKGDGGKKSSAPRGALEPRGVLVLKTPAGTGNAVTGARACGPWIFSNQVLSCSLRDPAEKASQTCGSSQGSAAPSSAPGAGDEPGSSASTTETALVRVQDERGVSYGVAYYNRHALISARFLSEDADELIDHNFFLSRFRTALQSRMSFSRSFSWSMHGHSQRDTVDVCRSEFHGGDKATEVRDMFFRLVNGEGDGLPGLVVDLYGEYACIQSLTRGMDSLMPLATAALRSLLSLGGILVRRDRPDRALEFPHAEGAGDTDRSFAAWRSEPVVAEGVIPSHVVLAENGCAFAVDLRAQPETGWRFDRREFRRQVALLSAGKRVLDLSGHSAACGITCVHLGKADRCVVVDNNEQSAMLALKGMNLNGITSARLEVQQEDVDTWLKNYASRLVSDGDPCYFDVVILDLPNLAWRKSDVPGARASLRQLVETVARVTAPGGYLAITNSSRHYSQGTFLADASVACASAGRDAVLCAEGGAGFDFPVDVRLPRSPELQWTILELSER